MPDPETSRLAQLKERWESDPTSRVFVQLAEEHRRRGEPREALAVLEAGLAHHPAYLSARVAVARCQLDLGLPAPALSHLEEVLEKDPTHLVAGKLVVEAHLALGSRDAARDALARYRLLGAPEEEIEELEDQFRRPAGPGETTPEVEEPASPEAAPEPAGERDSTDQVLFALPTAPAPRLDWPLSNGDDRREVRGALDEEPFRLEIGPGSAAVPDPAGPWPSLWSEPGEAETSGPPLEPPPPRDEPEPAAEEEVATAPALEEMPPEPTAPPTPEPADTPEPEGLAATSVSSEEVASSEEPAAASHRSTATLGDLYLRQGHLEEAEAIYRGVLDRDPGNEAARMGLETLALRKTAWLSAGDLLPPTEPRPPGLTATKRRLLERYLKRLKEGAGRDVRGSTS